ncbi:2'-5' RNA ligase family protein [Pontibacter qinzhouensis]|uniref:2'-5' RNA ligase family protein n=1 Tax=Pontibacter qinzhouensis TaxID=2603253 RepID=A0A5C8KFK5_9BACT|nr:2'-5' RNA ligase family protein [Pontibacter qinzhouensis]TXK52323.1 2'-5' RNA ligase family protein [Pontibacter qinzhouensis]
MIAITSLLDKVYSDRVTELTELLEKKFGLKGVKMSPYPHLTFLTAEIPDLDEMKEYLERVCLETPVFNVRTTGLGIFPGAAPVIYVPVLRTSRLNLFHGNIHRDIAEMSVEMSVYYNPNMWLPHISLALGDTTPEILGPVLNFLNTYNFNWDISLDNLTLMRKSGDFYLKEEEFQFSRRELIT